MMVPDCTKRLEAALVDLQAILVRRNPEPYQFVIIIGHVT